MDYLSTLFQIITIAFIPGITWQQIKIDKLEKDKIRLINIVYEFAEAVTMNHRGKARAEKVKTIKEKLEKILNN
ncbi:MAG: hypothetical protein SGJ02_05765 [bacterium]|nr:hypothetical protein [bacterium]